MPKKAVAPIDGSVWALFENLSGRRVRLGRVQQIAIRGILRVIAAELEEQHRDAARRTQSEDKEIARAGMGQIAAIGPQLAALRSIDRRVGESFHRMNLNQELMPDPKFYQDIPRSFQTSVEDELARWVDDGGK